MRLRVKYFLVVILGFMSLCLLAQTKKPVGTASSSPSPKKADVKLGILLRPYDRSVTIRWAPTDYIAWEIGKKFGYHVYRQEVINGVKDGKEVKLTSSPIKPISIEEFKKYTDTSEVAKKAIFAINTDTATKETLQQALEKEKDRNFGFAMGLVMANVHPLVARLSGLSYTDETVQRGKEYYYEVKSADLASVNTIRAWGTAVPGQSYTMPQPFQFYGKAYKNIAVLQWRTDFMGFDYAYYDIYRSDNPDKNFKKVNKLPYVGFVSQEEQNKITKYQDTLPSIDKQYYYKIVGVNTFGDEGPSSEVIHVKAKQSLYRNPVITRAFSKDNKIVTIEWAHPMEEKKNVVGFFIQRTDDPLRGYSLLNKVPLPASATRYLDRKPLPAGFYRIITVGIADDSAYSLNEMVQLVDSIPPVVPTGLVGIADTNGIVKINWKRNTETDLEGYRVFRTFGKLTEFTRLTPGSIKDTFLIDTISMTLGHQKAIYKVVALDKHYNPSKYSVGLEVKMPDITPPSAPQLTSYDIKPYRIKIQWQNSLAIDLAEQHVLRKGEFDYDWKVIASIKGAQLDSLKAYVDTTAKPGQSYTYALQAIDLAGLKSAYSKQWTFKAVGERYKPAVKQIAAYPSTANNMIKLAWEYDHVGINRFVLYRKSKEGKMEVLENLQGSAREYYDKRVKPDSEYSYYIMAHFTDWSQSYLSKPVVVKY